MTLEDKIDIEEKFNNALAEWKREIGKYHGNIIPTHNHSQGYQKIVSLGIAALPYIQKELNVEVERINNPTPENMFDYTPLFGWGYVVEAIIPEFNIQKGEENSTAPIKTLGCGFVGINPQQVIELTLDWLDKNMERYLHKDL
ncbi:MAG: hypothetical protein A2912_01305 [Candidatus Buchananbacteria bacterium RIFCSPLOWO2_01_FULL_40_23b]|uniref:Uncharacterized protein n=1 Tax=Candidatus Buchananbacteria bacterium RIFCSPLOWO2_01_FULL_40_23b TaxID=1797544 RepID=A0A1G1YVY3_9BACT|nr:MAG: hypothetical protein A2912_01305 [Candidatus Buchananbacteria bacterium RIFCSPLOWO2_01_FULL_40_23b]